MPEDAFSVRGRGDGMGEALLADVEGGFRVGRVWGCRDRAIGGRFLVRFVGCGRGFTEVRVGAHFIA